MHSLALISPSAPLAPRRSGLGPALLFGGLTLAVSAIGGRITSRNKGWYRLVRKSKATPPDATFGWVWPVLYALGVWSAVRVARQPKSMRRTATLGLWVGQLGANAAWAPLFFGAHRPRLAMAMLATNAALLTAYAVAARPVDPVAPVLVLPNLAWLAFAGTLNAAVVRKNPWLTT